MKNDPPWRIYSSPKWTLFAGSGVKHESVAVGWVSTGMYLTTENLRTFSFKQNKRRLRLSKKFVTYYHCKIHR